MDDRRAKTILESDQTFKKKPDPDPTIKKKPKPDPQPRLEGLRMTAELKCETNPDPICTTRFYIYIYVYQAQSAGQQTVFFYCLTKNKFSPPSHLKNTKNISNLERNCIFFFVNLPPEYVTLNTKNSKFKMK